MKIVVVGAGIIGLATGWCLHRDGHDVTLCDPAPGSGATYAAGGMLTPVAEAYHGEDHLTELLLASARRYPALVEDVAAHLPEGTPTGYLASGTLICGVDAADRDDLTALHELCLRLGLGSEQVTTRQARRLEPLLGPHLTCAFHAPDDHQVDPRLFADALLMALQRSGVEIVTEAVARVQCGERPSVTTRTGALIDADLVVVANGLGAPALEGDLGVDLAALLRPIHGEVLRLAVPPHLSELLTRTVRGRVAGRPVYLIPRGDGRVLLGASSREDGVDAVNAGGIHDLLADAIHLMPAVREFGVEDMVSRARPGTPDNAPIIGQTAPGVLVADGFFRHGILLAPVAADIVAALARRHAGTGNPDDDRLLQIARCADPRRFDRGPGARAGAHTPATNPCNEPLQRTRATKGRHVMTDTKAVTITVNDAKRSLPEGATCRDLIAEETGRAISEDGRSETGEGLGVALAREGEVVPRGVWASTPVSDGDRFELVTAVQGG